jgi:hypothetical protein
VNSFKGKLGWRVHAVAAMRTPAAATLERGRHLVPLTEPLAEALGAADFAFPAEPPAEQHGYADGPRSSTRMNAGCVAAAFRSIVPAAVDPDSLYVFDPDDGVTTTRGRCMEMVAASPEIVVLFNCVPEPLRISTSAA